MLNQILIFLAILPLVVYVSMSLLPNTNEKAISTLAIILATVCLLLNGWLSINLFMNGEHFLHLVKLYDKPEFEFSLTLQYEFKELVFSWVGALVYFFVARFSKFYLHRDEGFKRYFSTITLFFGGYLLVTLSANYETLFIGWELMGLSSFLLISFYRDRYLPIKNALKTLSFFRISDVLLLITLWQLHHIFHTNIVFDQLEGLDELGKKNNIFIIGLLIFVSAMVKSALFPFSSWLPRAMEGPTSSSAIFYGSLSLHIGLMLMLKSHAIWENALLLRCIMGFVGVLTALVANHIASVQSTVKTQIAYAALAQVGIMYLELALGLQYLVLFHFMGHALLRTYQLLVSPSVLNYKIHDMFFNFKKTENTKPLSGFSASMYALALNEWHLDRFMRDYLWSPFKKIGQSLNKLPNALLPLMSLILVAFELYLDINHDWIFATVLILALFLVLRAFASRKSAEIAMFELFLSQMLVGSSIFLFKDMHTKDLIWFFIGPFVGFAFLYLGFKASLKYQSVIDLSNYRSISKQAGYASKMLLFGFLALIGFPICTTFIGIDLIYTYLDHHEWEFALILGLQLMFIELASLRIYARIAMGIPLKNDGPVAFRSS